MIVAENTMDCLQNLAKNTPNFVPWVLKVDSQLDVGCFKTQASVESEVAVSLE